MIYDLTGLHVIVGGDRAIELATLADQLGASVIQLREKDRPLGEILDVADAIRTRVTHAAFIINDRADIARAVHADGVHLGSDDLPVEYARVLLGPDAIIGATCGSLTEAMEAQTVGANYIGFGHIYPTRSKEKRTPQKTLQEVSDFASAISVPLIAIGGITPANAAPVLQAGASGIAVIGAIQNSDDPARTIRELLALVNLRATPQP
ncbi:MAG: thiamine phosphate synthase [Bacteroidota bacterium]|nr:thiamine phosphate synthase [Bacteroidota bacterium]MDP4231823.1 thiamine phosphate synthase [Bacteroidota bacterium]MDP4242709.1 thiamine phosphate synthase [Bacteroidota bacterium]MDP4287160.1 thiamine phosphate synthase [Bacteroidota bacterium]